MKDLICKTNNEWAGLIARVTIGGIMLPHGLQKTLGCFGGYGFEGTMAYFTGSGLPWIIAFLVVFLESAGAIALLLGFAGRLIGLSYIILLLGMISFHLPNGLFMNWYGQQSGEGFEYHILMIGLALIVAVGGSGKYSLDGCCGQCCKNKELK